jgi:hypothetical protein
MDILIEKNLKYHALKSLLAGYSGRCATENNLYNFHAVTIKIIVVADAGSNSVTLRPCTQQTNKVFSASIKL